MQALQCLLLDGLDAHRHDVGAAQRFEQGRGIGGIGLVALDAGADLARWQQRDRDALVLESTGPEVRRAAGLHHHLRHGTVVKPTLELTSGQAMPLDDAPVTIGDGQLEDVLCQIHGDGRSIPLGLLLVGADAHTI